MKFGSWTYDGTKIDLRFLEGIPEGSTAGFSLNGEWDVLGKQALQLNIIPRNSLGLLTKIWELSTHDKVSECPISFT